jgi:short-subunit dehydrogenase
MSNFPSKGIALIAGASTSIGAVYADRLAKRGYDLILVARNETGLRALCARLVRDTGARVEVPSSRSDVEIGPRSRRWHGRFRLKKRAE